MVVGGQTAIALCSLDSCELYDVPSDSVLPAPAFPRMVCNAQACARTSVRSCSGGRVCGAAWAGTWVAWECLSVVRFLVCLPD